MLLYYISSASLLELGRNVCNEMWSNTESNLEVPDELNVDIKKDHAWFELTSKGKEKVDASKVFGTFEGSYFLKCLSMVESQLNRLFHATLL